MQDLPNFQNLPNHDESPFNITEYLNQLRREKRNEIDGTFTKAFADKQMVLFENKLTKYEKIYRSTYYELLTHFQESLNDASIKKCEISVCYDALDEFFYFEKACTVFSFELSKKCYPWEVEKNIYNKKWVYTINLK